METVEEKKYLVIYAKTPGLYKSLLGQWEAGSYQDCI